jgi:site-specific DNA-methyltransferase (adenine-specific)
MPSPYYSHNGITIYLADCFEVLHTLEGVGAVVTDVPYSSGGAFRGDRMFSTLSKYASSDSSQQQGIGFTGDNRDQRAFLAWCALWMTAARGAALEGATFATFIDWRQLPTITDAIQAGGWVWRGVGVWSKKFGRPRDGGFSGACEFLPWASHGPLLENGSFPSGAFQHAGAIEPSIEYSPPPVAQRHHLAEKPLPVMEWAMANVPPGALVVDPFMGSGSTLVVAQRRGLRAIGIDVDERQCEIAAKRLSQGMLAGLAIEDLEASAVEKVPDVGAGVQLQILD